MARRVPIHIYDDFPSDFVRLGDPAQAQVRVLLQALQISPYDSRIQEKCFQHGEIYEYPLVGGYSILWEVKHERSSIMNMQVWIVAIERRPIR